MTHHAHAHVVINNRTLLWEGSWHPVQVSVGKGNKEKAGLDWLSWLVIAVRAWTGLQAAKSYPLMVAGIYLTLTVGRSVSGCQRAVANDLNRKVVPRAGKLCAVQWKTFWHGNTAGRKTFHPIRPHRAYNCHGTMMRSNTKRIGALPSLVRMIRRQGEVGEALGFLVSTAWSHPHRLSSSGGHETQM